YAKRDYLDDGSPVQVEIEVKGERATIDFSGTGPVLATNLNANRAIVTAAVMYVFRCLIEETIPLNSGVLEPLDIVLPECLLRSDAKRDYLDDGSPVQVEIEVKGERATIDFSGTGPVLATNLNANRAIVTAAVMYVFRCLIEETIPLNSGVLEPLDIVLPECLL